MTRSLLGLWLVCWASSVSAQTTITANRLRLSDGPCAITSSNGSPDKLVFSVCPVLTTSAATNLTLAPTGDLVLGPVGTDILPDVGYTQNLGALSNKYLTLHAAELWVETLVAQNTIATIGGRVLVAPTTTLTSDLASGATSIDVKHNEMANGDRVYLEANGKVEFLAITSGPSGSGPYTYSVTRNLDGSGANDWFAGDAILNTGTTGDGFIDLYSVAGVISGSGPTIVGNVRTGTTYNNIAPRWAIGNLNGLYGYGATTYGTAFGDSSATNITIDATNGFRIRSGTTNKLVADTSANLSLTGDLLIGSAGTFRMSGATAYGTGTGLWIGDDGGTYKFRIGNPSGNRLTWDGATLTVLGDGSGVTNINGGNIQTGTVSASRLTVGSGRNQLPNPDCGASTYGWTATTDTGLGQTLSRALTNYTLNGENVCYMTLSGTPSAGQTSAMSSTSVPVIAGNKYEATVYLGVHRSGNTTVNIYWYNTSGTFISSSTGTNCTTSNNGGNWLAGDGGSYSGYCRSGVIATAPTGAVNAVTVVYTTHTAEASPYVFYVHAFFGEALVNQTEYTPWGAGGLTEIVGGMIRTGTIVADNIAASTITGGKIAATTITASNLNVSTLSAITANLGTITAGTVSGVTATFGGGTMTLNSSGMSISAGTGTANKIVWTDGGEIFGNNSDSLLMRADSSVGLYVLAGGSESITVGVNSILLDPSSDGTISTHFIGGGTRFVCVDNAGALFSSTTACN